MRAIAKILADMQKNMDAIFATHDFAKEETKVYISLHKTKAMIDSLQSAMAAEAPGIRTDPKELRKPIFDLIYKHQDDQIIGILKGKYGIRNAKRKIAENDFDDDEIIEIWRAYTEEDSDD